MLRLLPQAGESGADTGPGALALSCGLAGGIAVMPPFMEVEVRAQSEDRDTPHHSAGRNGAAAAPNRIESTRVEICGKSATVAD